MVIPATERGPSFTKLLFSSGILGLGPIVTRLKRVILN